jgi:hypothetical protein
MLKTKNLLGACAVGAITFGLIAFFTAHTVAWIALAILAGAAAGYIGYELKDFFTAIPAAWRAAGNFGSEIWEGLKEISQDLGKIITDWLEDPFKGIGLLAGLASGSFIVWNFYHSPSLDPQPTLLTTLVCSILGAFLCGFIIGGFFQIAYFTTEWSLEKVQGRVLQLPETYGRVLRYGLLGFLLIPFFLLWLLWFGSILGLAHGIVTLLKFFRLLILMTHKDGRVIAAIDGPLGGMMAYLLTHSSCHAWSEKGLGILCGAMIATALGLLSKRIVEAQITSDLVKD